MKTFRARDPINGWSYHVEALPPSPIALVTFRRGEETILTRLDLGKGMFIDDVPGDTDRVRVARSIADSLAAKVLPPEAAVSSVARPVVDRSAPAAPAAEDLPSRPLFTMKVLAGAGPEIAVRPPLEPPTRAEASDVWLEKAKSLARLVVSEIKLYNESKVAEGRRHRDLYARLKEDIERGRELYEKKVPADVRRSTNYFNEELVRTLAEGDASALGARAEEWPSGGLEKE